MSRLRQSLGLLLIVGLVLACVLLVPGPRRSTGQPGSTHNTSGSGAAALELWLQELGYQTRRLEYQDFALQPTDHALFVITPDDEFNRAEIEELLRWLREDGGTLVLIADRPSRLFNELNVGLAPQPELDEEAYAVQPLNHPALHSIPLQSASAFVLLRDDAAVLLESAGEPVLVALTEGRGLVYICSCTQAPTNAGLRDQRNAALALNLLNRVPAGGSVVFDEIHHGLQIAPAPAPRGPRGRSPLAQTPAWWGLLYAAMVLVLFILLTGRRFGRPVPLREELARRSSAEYVQSMAGLLERGRKTGYVLRHYKEQLKRRLAKPYGFNPRVSDAEFVQELTRFQPLDHARLAELLRRMDSPAPEVTALLRLVQEADRLAQEIESQRR